MKKFRGIFLILIAISVILGCQNPANTVPPAEEPQPPSGSLDTTFGMGGIVTTPNMAGLGTAIQMDGKIVVAGTNDSNADIILARYETDGSLDASFGTGGIVTTAIGSGSDVCYDVAIQSDGKIVVAGFSYNGANNDFALVRYGTDGTLDASFGTGGIVTTAIGLNYDFGCSVAIQADGKIVVAGYSYNGANDDFALVRYGTDGTLDVSFGTGGIVTTPIGANSDRGFSVAIQTDGKIMVAGSSYNGTNEDFALVRYGTDGTLDASFGTGGIVTTAIGLNYDFGCSVAIQADGKIVVAGYSYNGANDDFALVRYGTDGTLDVSFGTGGIVTTPIGANSDRGFSVAIQTDGKIMVAGSSYNGTNEDFALVRYGTDGTLDASFGTGGKVRTVITSEDWGSAVAIQTDGKIIVAGSSFSGLSITFAIARYEADGTIDTSFGWGGIVTTAIVSEDLLDTLAIQADGKIVGAGYFWNGTANDLALVRYWP